MQILVNEYVRAYCWEIEDRRKVQVRLSKPEQQQLDELLSGGLQPVRNRAAPPGAAVTGRWASDSQGSPHRWVDPETFG